MQWWRKYVTFKFEKSGHFRVSGSNPDHSCEPGVGRSVPWWEVREVEREDVNQSSKFVGEYLGGYLLKLSRILWASRQECFSCPEFLVCRK